MFNDSHIVTDKENCSSLIIANILHLTQTFLLELSITHCQDFINQKQIGIGMDRQTESEPHKHSGRVGANRIINDLLSALAAAEKTITDCPISAHALDELANLIDAGTINSTQGREVFSEMFATGKGAAAIVKEKGLEQVSDTGAIEALCDQAIAASPKAVAEYQAGKLQAINSIKGQVMKLSQGKANPAVVGEILAKKLSA